MKPPNSHRRHEEEDDMDAPGFCVNEYMIFNYEELFPGQLTTVCDDMCEIRAMANRGLIGNGQRKRT